MKALATIDNSYPNIAQYGANVARETLFRLVGETQHASIEHEQWQEHNVHITEINHFTKGRNR